jgi:hypothetical protein
MQIRYIRKDKLLVLEILLTAVFCAVAILAWLGSLGLSQDSTGYITSSENLVKSGQLTTFVNYTNWINEPAILPYIDQPPGFPLLLAPFIVIFHDPINSVLVAQSVFIILFYLFVYLMTRRLQFSSLLSLITLILITFMQPLFLIHNYYWTETLFIGLSVGAAYFAIGLLGAPDRKKDWIVLIILLALTSLIRYTGIANIALLIPFLFKKDSLRVAWNFFTNKYILMSFSLVGGLVIALSFAVDLLPNAKSGIGLMQWFGILLGTIGSLIGIVGFLITRKHRHGLMEQQPLATHLYSSTWAIFALLGSVGPILFWIFRNIYFFHLVSQQNNPLQTFQVNKFIAPFQYVWRDLLDLNFIPRALLALFAAGLLLLPLSRLPIIGMNGPRRTAHSVILITAVAHFLLVWLATLTTSTEPVGFRYFTPVLVFLILGLLNGVQQISQFIRPFLWRQLILAAPLFFLTISTSFHPLDMLKNMGRINYPRERQLWQELNKLDWVRAASYFYSDDDYYAGGYLHQIFSGKPQGILWDPAVVNDPQQIISLLSRAGSPFILVTIKSSESQILDRMITQDAIPLVKIVFPDAGYILYHLNNK